MAKGRPKKVIDQTTFEKLCGIQCTESEICAVLGVTEKTLDKWCHATYKAPFSIVFQQKRGVGKASLRRKQWQLADKNPAMAIWLGKQYLDQREPGVKVDVTTDNDQVQQFLDSLRDGGESE